MTNPDDISFKGSLSVSKGTLKKCGTDLTLRKIMCFVAINILGQKFRLSEFHNFEILLTHK